jgi:DNA-binding GntR family transcriptional regulator
VRQIAALHGDIGKAYDTHLAIVERLRAGDGAGAALAVTTNFELFAISCRPEARNNRDGH